MLCENAPKEYADRSTLWNAVEKSEKAVNAQLAREIEIALPVELSREQQIELTKQYVKRNFVENGMCADVCVHDTGTGNPHAHIMLTMRPFNEDKTWGLKERKCYVLDGNGERIPLINPKTGTQKVDRRNRKQWKREYVQVNDWNFRGNAEEWREKWSEEVNAFMERENHADRVDHRSYKRQGVEQIPTVHLGVAAHQMETRKGVKTERGNRNREVENINREIRQLRARIRKATEWIYSQPIEDAPKMVEIATRISKGENLNTQWKKIASLQTSAKLLFFMQNNSITDMAQLADKVKKINNEFYDVAKSIKAVDRRIETLTEHLAQYEIRKQNKAVYEKYNAIQPALADKILRRDPKADFYEKHGKEIRQFESAKDYFGGGMNGRTKIPIKEWKAEHEKLTAERFNLCESYYRLKDEVHNVEILRKGAEEIMREETQREQRTRKREMEL
jgi:ATP-dependent exoDNAse (exonuclease V) alpha subunit